MEWEPWEHRGTAAADSAVVEVTFGIKRSSSAFSQCLQKAASHGFPSSVIQVSSRGQASGLRFVARDTETLE